MYAFWSGLIGIIIMFLLLVTSNNVSQRIVWLWIWKRLQQLVYPLFIVVVIHIYFIGWWKAVYLYPAILLFSLRFYSWSSKNFHYTWRQRVSHSGYRRFLCPPCGFIYDEELWDIDWWLAPGTRYEEIPDDWICPVCWAAKKDFIPLDGHYNPEDWEDHELNFTIVSKKNLTSDVIELQLYCERDLEIIPGQFCNLIFESDGEKQMRSYSVSLYRDKILTFLIKLKDGW
jgi:rubredoxin